MGQARPTQGEHDYYKTVCGVGQWTGQGGKCCGQREAFKAFPKLGNFVKFFAKINGLINVFLPF